MIAEAWKTPAELAEDPLFNLRHAVRVSQRGRALVAQADDFLRRTVYVDHISIAEGASNHLATLERTRQREIDGLISLAGVQEPELVVG